MMPLSEKIQHLHFLAVGQVTHDRYGDQISPGGCAFFGARAAQGLGAQVRLLTSVGADFICDNALKDLEVNGIREGKTTVFTNSYPAGGLRVQHVETQSPPIQFNHLPDSWRKTDALFVAPVFEEINPSEPWFTDIETRFTSVCLQGFMKTARRDTDERRVVIKGQPLDFTNSFQRVDAFFLSAEDIELFGSPGLLDALISRAKYVFVTLGEEGCRIHEGNKVSQSGIYRTNTVDPTGAGDTFAAATTCALACGADALSAAHLGAAAASFVVEKYGSEGLDNIPENAFPRFTSLNF